jgi:signal transduction histidine kinase
MRAFGLRARVTAGFAVGALVLSAVMALVSYLLVRTSLLDERERSAVRAAYFNATTVNSGLSGDDPNIVEVLRSLDVGEYRHVVLRRDGAWHARNVDEGITAAIPQRLLQAAEDGEPVVQRIRVDGRPSVIVAVPLPSAVFYEIDSLAELDRTLQVLALALTAVAIMTAVGGAAVGWYATRHVLRPLTSVARAAREIASGDVRARLDAGSDPDLAHLTTSFNDMVDELDRRMRRDRRFAGDVSHELRSPLQTLSAAAGVLQHRREHLDERSAIAAGLVADEVQRFQALVDDLLQLARSDQPVQREPVDVADCARRLCRTRNIEEDLVQVQQNTPRTWLLDPRRVEQILANLIDNAIRYGGGPTAVRLGHTGDRCFMEVDDAGPGVTLEDRGVIFDRFVRGRAANARGVGDGTGLGLALVAEHAAAHGGRAVVLDRPGGGARMRVEFTGCLP